MRHNVKAVPKVPDIRFLQRTGAALLLMAIVAGSVTVFGAATTRQDNLNLLSAWQVSQADAAY